MKKLLITFVTMGAMIAGFSSFAASDLADACKSDLKKFACKAGTDAEIHECLEKNEKEGKKHEGFTRKCHKAHESYEKKMGKEEKKEHEHKESGKNY